MLALYLKFVILEKELRECTLRTGFVLKVCDFAAGAAGLCSAYRFGSWSCMVGVQKLEGFCFFGMPARPSVFAFLAFPDDASWSLAIVSWFARLLSESRGRGFDPRLVRGSSGCKIGNFKYKSSTRSRVPRDPLRGSAWSCGNVLRVLLCT